MLRVRFYRFELEISRRSSFLHDEWALNFYEFMENLKVQNCILIRRKCVQKRIK